MAKYDSTIFGEARSETADRRSGRTERIIRNESSADFLSAVSQPVRQMFYLQSGNCLGSRDRPSGTPSSPANGRAGFVPFGLGPKSGIIGSFPAARMLCRFARTPIRATATDRSPSDSAGCSRLPFSVRTTGHELIRSSDEPSDFAVGNIPVETDVDPMPFVHMVAGLYALVAVPQIDRLVRVALQKSNSRIWTKQNHLSRTQNTSSSRSYSEAALSNGILSHAPGKERQYVLNSSMFISVALKALVGLRS